MAGTLPIPVRLSPEIIARLDAVAESMGNTRAGVIKLCLAAFLDSYERSGGVALPLNWEQMLDELDGRTKQAKAKDSASSLNSADVAEAERACREILSEGPTPKSAPTPEKQQPSVDASRHSNRRKGGRSRDGGSPK